MAHSFRGFSPQSAGSETETAQQNRVIEENCSLQGSQEGERKARSGGGKCTLPSPAPSDPSLQTDPASECEASGGHFKSKP